MLGDGVNVNATAKKFGVTHDSLSRHVKSCMPKQLKKAVEEKRAALTLSTHERLRELDADALRLGKAARRTWCDLPTALAAIREMVRIVELRAKLFGDIDKPATVNVLVQHPDWIQLQAIPTSRVAPSRRRVRLC